MSIHAALLSVLNVWEAPAGFGVVRLGHAALTGGLAVLGIGLVCRLLPEAKVNSAAPSVTLDWRVFAPDPAAAPSLAVSPANETGWADWLPLVCRATDQLLLLVLAPPEVESVTITKSGRSPLLRDLRTGRIEAEAPLSFPGKEKWGRAGLFVVDP